MLSNFTRYLFFAPPPFKVDSLTTLFRFRKPDSSSVFSQDIEIRIPGQLCAGRPPFRAP